MPTEIELSPDKSRIALVRREDARVIASFRFDPLSVKSQAGAAVKAGVDVGTLLQWIDQVRQTGATHKFSLGATSTDSSEFLVRDIEASDGERCKKKAPIFLTENLTQIPVDKLLFWTDTEACCCLDLDYHELPAPERLLLSSLVYSRLAPKPFCWHFSRGGGLHLFYIAHNGFTAEELASVAALRFRMIDPTAGVELKHGVRGPGSETVVYSGEQDTTGTLLEWLREPEQEVGDVEEYLEEEGLEIGRRYDHDKCPLHPTEDGGKHRMPVILRESGVHCFVCEGKERYFGSRRPGFFPWAAILGQPTAGDMGAMIRSLCHWGHAKWILRERYGLTGLLAERAYRTALKAYHQGRPTEPLVAGCFNKHLDGYTRVGYDWMNLDEVKKYSSAIQSSIQAMPTTQYVDGKGVIRSNPVIVTNLLEPMDLGKYGYPSIDLIFGSKMAAEFLGHGKRTLVAIPNPNLVRKGGPRFLPAYVPKSSRMGEEKARSIIEQIVPRVDWNLIQCVLCGVGSVQETELGLPPRLFVTGPSRAAKTSHFMIAAGIAGVKTGSPSAHSTEERLRQGLMEAIQTAPIVLINEVLKDAYRTNKRASAVQALEPILNLEKESLTHVLYKGPREFGKQFLLGFTEVQLPPDLRNETQIARRIRYHRLDREKRDWVQTISAAGVSDLHLLRLASPEVADACNAVLSEVIDRFFVTPMTFQQQAEELGIKTLEDSGDFVDLTPYLRQFFKLVCLAPRIENERLAKLYPNYVRIDRGAEDTSDDTEELVATYTMFADGPGAEWFSARKLIEKDWGTILGIEENVKLVLSHAGSSVFVRFQVGPMNKPTKVNAEIVDPTLWRPVL